MHRIRIHHNWLTVAAAMMLIAGAAPPRVTGQGVDFTPQRRDTSAAPTTGTAAISGRLVTDDAAPQPIDAQHGKAQAQNDTMFRIVGRVPEEQAVTVERSGQILLRQGRALVRQRSLIADERDRAGVTALAERLHGLCRSLPGADDGYSLIAHCVHTI